MRSKTRKHFKKQRAGKYLGKGFYGCAHMPALKCEGETNRRLGTDGKPGISKLFGNETAAFEELDGNMAIKQIDINKKYFLTDNSSCVLGDLDYRENTMYKDTGRFRETCDQQPITGKSILILSDNGGLNLDKVTIPKQNLANFLVGLLNLFEGLELLHANNITHMDIKGDNILCRLEDDSNYTIRYIDFGLSINNINIPSKKLSDNINIKSNWSRTHFNITHYPMDAMFYTYDTNINNKSIDKNYLKSWYSLPGRRNHYPKYSYWDYKETPLLDAYSINDKLKYTTFYDMDNTANQIKSLDVFSLGYTLYGVYTRITGHVSSLDNKGNMVVISPQDSYNIDLANKFSKPLFSLISNMVLFFGELRPTAKSACSTYKALLQQVGLLQATVAPTTVAPATVAPATVAPATVAPVTVLQQPIHPPLHAPVRMAPGTGLQQPMQHHLHPPMRRPPLAPLVQPAQPAFTNSNPTAKAQMRAQLAQTQAEAEAQQIQAQQAQAQAHYERAQQARVKADAEAQAQLAQALAKAQAAAKAQANAEAKAQANALRAQQAQAKAHANAAAKAQEAQAKAQAIAATKAQQAELARAQAQAKADEFRALKLQEEEARVTLRKKQEELEKIKMQTVQPIRLGTVNMNSIRRATQLAKEARETSQPITFGNINMNRLIKATQKAREAREALERINAKTQNRRNNKSSSNKLTKKQLRNLSDEYIRRFIKAGQEGNTKTANEMKRLAQEAINSAILASNNNNISRPHSQVSQVSQASQPEDPGLQFAKRFGFKNPANDYRGNY